ncbi:MAG: SgcJ/EcaC family oxidoreductase [Gemmatimonadales bacterium]
MSKRLIALLGAAFVAACSGEKAPEPAEVTAMATVDPALEQVRADYVTHFNQHHAGVVGDLFADSAVFLGADGSIDDGKAAIVAGLEQAMATSPTLDLTTLETNVMGSQAVTRGEYQIRMTPPGGAEIALGGHYMTYFTRDGDAWKIEAVVTNYDAPPPAGLPAPRVPSGNPPENGTLAELSKAYTEHYNAGHASAVAALFTEDAIAMFPDQPAAEGRAAIEAALTQAIAEGSPQVTIHDIATMPAGDDMAIDGGWYELVATTPEGSATTTGAYMLLVRKGADGAWLIHRMIANGRPAPAS